MRKLICFCVLSLFLWGVIFIKMIKPLHKNIIFEYNIILFTKANNPMFLKDIFINNLSPYSNTTLSTIDIFELLRRNRIVRYYYLSGIMSKWPDKMIIIAGFTNTIVRFGKTIMNINKTYGLGYFNYLRKGMAGILNFIVNPYTTAHLNSIKVNFKIINTQICSFANLKTVFGNFGSFRSGIGGFCSSIKGSPQKYNLYANDDRLNKTDYNEAKGEIGDFFSGIGQLSLNFQVCFFVIIGLITFGIIYLGLYLISINNWDIGSLLLAIGSWLLLTDFGWAACGSPFLFWNGIYNLLLGR